MPPSGTELWVHRYDGPAHDSDVGKRIATSPDGTKVFVTGASQGDYLTIAYDASTGAQLWRTRYNGPANGSDSPNALAVSPGGTKVFVTGPSDGGAPAYYDYATVAYNASTGAQLWVARYNGSANGYDYAYAVAVSPDATKVFVTGQSDGGATPGSDYATVAYDAATGAETWVTRYDHGYRPYSWEGALALAVSPAGTTVFVTGRSRGPTWDYATVAYGASSGAQLWVQRYNGPGNRIDVAYSVAVSPDGSKLFVTGGSDGKYRTDSKDYATIAYDASTGAELWVARHNGDTNFSLSDVAYSVAVNPDGTKVFVTGRSYESSTTRWDYATIAYTASTGGELWLTRYNDPANGFDGASAVAVGPAGGRVFVTGTSAGSTTGSDYATLAYDAFTGAQLWLRRYNGPANGFDSANSLVSRGGRVFVTGSSYGGAATGNDYVTIAYQN